MRHSTLIVVIFAFLLRVLFSDVFCLYLFITFSFIFSPRLEGEAQVLPFLVSWIFLSQSFIFYFFNLDGEAPLLLHVVALHLDVDQLLHHPQADSSLSEMNNE